MFAPRILLLLGVLTTLTSRAFSQAALDALLAKETLWTLDQDRFEEAAAELPFRWTSNSRDSARAAGERMTIFGLPVAEAIARFDKGTLSQLDANIYARGDVGDLPEERFRSLITIVIDRVTKATGVKHTVRGKDAKSAVNAEGIEWRTPTAFYTLEYSFTKAVKTRGIPFRAEFVRLEITPPVKSLGLLASAANLNRSKFNGPLHVKRDQASGDTWLADVPMVDQGQRGYCVVATTERVMRYYGTNVDANELAQIANSDSEGGTSLNAMRDSLKKVSAKLRVRVRDLEKLDVKDVLSLIKDYNRAAKRAGADQIADPGSFIDMGAVFAQMRGEVLKEAKTKNRSDLNRFQHNVQANIDQGVPLLWSVQLGMVPEPGIPQTAGGHMRLIIGYNSKTEEILYSDSWGRGHELKRMKADDAWTITTTLMKIEPIS